MSVLVSDSNFAPVLLGLFNRVLGVLVETLKFTLDLVTVFFL